jgi:ribosomal protein L7/L12
MGFLKNLSEHFNPTPVPIESLRPDLQRCIGDLHPTDAAKFLSWCGAYGGPLAEIPASEAVLAVLPPVSLGGRGLLVLTSGRLLFAGEMGRIEVPMHRLSVSGIGGDRWGNTLQVGVAPSNDPVHEFGISTTNHDSRDRFLRVFEATVREAENRAAQGGSSPLAPASAADELAKFASLRGQGIISEAEFQTKKSQLLGLGDGGQATAAQPPSVYDVVLQTSGRNSIKVIKVLRATMGLSLKDAKNLVDSAPSRVKTSNGRAEAEELCRQLENVGATAGINAR